MVNSKPTVPNVDDKPDKSPEDVLLEHDENPAPENMEFEESDLLGEKKDGLSNTERFMKTVMETIFFGLGEKFQERAHKSGSANALAQMTTIKQLATIEEKQHAMDSAIQEIQVAINKLIKASDGQEAANRQWRVQLTQDILKQVRMSGEVEKNIQSSSNTKVEPCRKRPRNDDNRDRKRHRHENRDHQLKERKPESAPVPFHMKYACIVCMTNRHKDTVCPVYTTKSARTERMSEIGICQECYRLHSGPCHADDEKKPTCNVCGGRHHSCVCPKLSDNN